MSIDFGGSQIGEIYYGSELVGVLGGAEVEEVPIEAVEIGGSSTYHDIVSVDAGEGAWVWFKADITRYNSSSAPVFHLNEERFGISISESNVAGGGHYTGEVKLQVLTTSGSNTRTVSFSGKLYVMRERIVRHVTELTGGADVQKIPVEAVASGSSGSRVVMHTVHVPEGETWLAALAGDLNPYSIYTNGPELSIGEVSLGPNLGAGHASIAAEVTGTAEIALKRNVTTSTDRFSGHVYIAPMPA